MRISTHTPRALLTGLALVVVLVARAESARAQGTMVPEGAPAPAPADATAPTAQPVPAPTTSAAPTQAAPAATATAPPAETTTTISTESDTPVQGPVFTAPPAPAVAAQGQWVYTESYGWIWVPEGSTPVIVQEQPYVYLYTPAYGWTWYGSPWGPGRYYVGPWIHYRGPARVWHRGGWYAPHVVVRPRVVAPTVIHRGVVPRGGGGHRGHR